MPTGRALGGHSHDYKRNGTSTLFAAFEVATGKVTAAHKKRRRRIELPDIMNDIDPAWPRFAKHDHVVETFAADRADESLDVSILPGRSGCDRMVPNAHCTDPLQEDRTIRGVSTPNEISRRVVPRERLGDLARDHSAVGFAVTPNDTQSRRPWRTMTRQYRIWNAIVGRTKRSIAAMPST